MISSSSEVLYSLFDCLVKRFKKYERMVHSQEFSITYLYPGHVRGLLQANSHQMLFQQKQTIFKDDNFSYNVRVSLSKEQTTEHAFNHTQCIGTRARTRHKFIDGKFCYDFTEIVRDNVCDKTAYEVELEYLFCGDGYCDLPEWQRRIISLWKDLHGSLIIYTSQEKAQIIDDLGRLLGWSGSNIDKDSLVKPRNLKKRDLVYGGIVGNKTTSYVVSYKANGIRKLLVVNKRGLWLVHPPYNFNLFYGPEFSTDPSRVVDFLNKMSLTIYDCEALYSGERTNWDQPNNVKTTCLIFDCLCYADSDLRKRVYSSRIRYVRTLNNWSNSLANVSIAEKPVHHLLSVEGFFSTMKTIFENIDKQPWPTDGLVFSPWDVEYLPTAKRYPLNQRKLGVHYDVCKWKPCEEVTIDFCVRKDGAGQMSLSVYNGRELVSFVGSSINPLDPSKITWQSDILVSVPSGAIVEFEWKDAKAKAARQNRAKPRRCCTGQLGRNQQSNHTRGPTGIYLISLPCVPQSDQEVPIHQDTPWKQHP